MTLTLTHVSIPARSTVGYGYGLDDKDRLVARATSTCMTLRGDEARGR